MVILQELVETCNQWLQPEVFNDYCPNGLQVEGRSEVRKLVTGVTASQRLIDRAVADKADCLLVHHGYFWKGEAPEIVGIKYRRLRALIQNEISLLAYHLPLDAHPEFGNNVRLGELLGISVTRPLTLMSGQPLGLIGRLSEPVGLRSLTDRIGELLGRDVLVIEGKRSALERNEKVLTVGWCTGAAQGYFERAIEAGVDVYLSGEISEPTVHLARESGVHYLSAGHHATERYGVQALGERLVARFGLEHAFLDIDNPV